MYKASVVISTNKGHYTVLLESAASNELHNDLIKETTLFTSFLVEVSGNTLYQGFYKSSKEKVWEKLEKILLKHFLEKEFVICYLEDN